MTTTICNEILQEEIMKALAVGIPLDVILPGIKLKSFTSRYGDYSPATGQIRLCKEFVEKAPETEIRAVIMHEVLHSTRGSSGHDSIWRAAVNIVRNAYDYEGYEEFHLSPHPYGKERNGEFHPRYDLKSGTNIKKKSDVKKVLLTQYGVVLKCKDCKRYHIPTKKSMTKHPKRYRCNCGGKLKVIRQEN